MVALVFFLLHLRKPILYGTPCEGQPRLPFFDWRRDSVKSILSGEAKKNSFDLGESPCRLTHVVFPFYPGQVPKVKENIELWRVYQPCVSTDRQQKKLNVRLVFYLGHGALLDVKTSETIRSEIMTTFNNLPESTRSCFHSVSSEVIVLKKEDDTHLAGAQIMFEHMLSGRMSGMSLVGSVLYMEPDMLPVRRGWLEIIAFDARSSSVFLVRGSQFQGDAKRLPKHYENSDLYHINGNALYCFSGEHLRDLYFNHVQPWIAARHSSYESHAYDIDFWDYLYNEDNVCHARTLLSLYQYSDVIVNMWHSNYSLAALLATWPRCALVHGGTQAVP